MEGSPASRATVRKDGAPRGSRAIAIIVASRATVQNGARQLATEEEEEEGEEEEEKAR